jgi:hypothetical protein
MFGQDNFLKDLRARHKAARTPVLKEEVELDEEFIDLEEAVAELEEGKKWKSMVQWEDAAKKLGYTVKKQGGYGPIWVAFDHKNNRVAGKYNLEDPSTATLQEEAVAELEEGKSSSGYELYHDTFSSAMKTAYDFAKSKYGITVDPEEIDSKVASGPKKPSAGKTNSYSLKGDKGTIQVQVYNMDNKKYELNVYKS